VKTVVVDPERCIGCLQCEFACAVEHSRTRDPFTAFAEDVLPRKRVHVEPGPTYNTSFPNKCRHCDPAPCQQVCPTGAISRDGEHDLVLIDPGKCIACGMCAMVCPFDAVTFFPLGDGAPERVTAVKCDGCVDRVRRAEVPACVEACKAGALVFGEINELVRAGRRRETLAVLAATATIRPAAPPAPEMVRAWRTWGAEAQAVGRTGGAR